MNENTVKVGVGIYVIKNGKILLGKRKGKHAAGVYAAPGGHLEYMESFEGCARREAKEETGIEIENVRFVRLLNLKDYAPKHYVHVTMIADWKSGEPKVMEPDKCESWDWYDLDKLPTPLFATVEADLKAYKTGKNFFDN